LAIDLFCYAATPPSAAKSTLDDLINSQVTLFKNQFTASEPRAPSPLQAEIAGEHGLCAASLFLVHLQDKQAAGLVTRLADAIKAAFGPDQVVVLFENETAL